MIRNRISPFSLGAVIALGLAGCQSQILPKAPEIADLSTETQRGERPTAPKGACWASDETPAVIQTVTENIAQDAAAHFDAGYLTTTVQEIVTPREKIWFQTPCAPAMTPEVISTLQRALAVRGVYVDKPTGLLDPATRRAIRAYQSVRGLNSDRLSLAAARDLGVVASDFGQSVGQ